MATKSYDNDAVNLQLALINEINELLKSRNVKVSQLKVDIKALKKKTDGKLLKQKRVFLEGTIFLKIDSEFNPNNSIYNFTDDLEEEELLDEDYLVQ